MDESWFVLKEQRPCGEHGETAQVEIPVSSTWFAGHFPGFPLLPGIAQIHMAFDFIRASEQREGRQVALSEIKKVRFRKMITPGSTVTLTVLRNKIDPLRYGFTISSGGETAAQGTIVIRPAE
jgi:3-hydroxyacyl-[acyl-carrier-protein] dehydratase